MEEFGSYAEDNLCRVFPLGMLNAPICGDGGTRRAGSGTSTPVSVAYLLVTLILLLVCIHTKRYCGLGELEMVVFATSRYFATVATCLELLLPLPLPLTSPSFPDSTSDDWW